MDEFIALYYDHKNHKFEQVQTVAKRIEKKTGKKTIPIPMGMEAKIVKKDFLEDKDE